MQTVDATVPSPAGEPYLARHDQERPATVLADSLRTRGAIGIVACDLEAGERHGWYRHATEDVGFLVVDGTLELRLAERRWTAAPLSLAFVPRGTAYGYRALSAARLVVLTLPAGLERFIEASGPAAAVDAALLLSLAQEHRVEVLPDFLS